MSLTTISIVLLMIFVISIIREPRSFWNALLLLVEILVSMLAFAAKPGVGGRIVGILIMLIPVIFIMTAIFLILNGLVMLKKEGHHLRNLLSLLLGVVMIAGSIGTFAGLYYFQDESVMRSIVYLVLLMELYISFVFVALFIYSILYTCIPKRINCDYIIVHGCGLLAGERVSPLLKGRVDKAVKIYNKSKKKPKIVVSGGKGSDEKISEALAMKNYLLQTGFPEEEIVLEDQSKTTFENLKNVKEMLDVNGVKHRYIFVTNNYHVFRTGLFARKLKMKAAGVGCTTAAYYWPSAFIREYIAIMCKYKWIAIGIILLYGLGEVLIHK